MIDGKRDYDHSTETVPVGSHFMLEVPGRREVAFLKDETSRVTRLSDAVYLSVAMLRDSRCRIVSKDEAHAAVRAEKEAFAAFMRGNAPSAGSVPQRR